MVTAHAMENGVLLYIDDGKRRIVAQPYGAEHLMLDDEMMAVALDLFEADPSPDLPDDTIEDLVNANYPGRESNTSELKDANIAYNIDDAGTPFLSEQVRFAVNGQFVSLDMPAELQGHKEVFVSATVEDADPLTVGEAAWLIEKISGEDLSDTSPEALKRSLSSYLVPELAEVAERIQTYLDEMDHHNWVMGRPVKQPDGSYAPSKAETSPRYLGLYGLIPNAASNEERDQKLAELVRRVFHTIKGNSLGGPWAHESRYVTSEREGVTDIMEELAIKGLSPQAQYIDDDLPDLDKQAREMNLFDQFYGPDKTTGKLINKGWSDRSLYFYRKKAERTERFHTLMHAIATLPEPLIVKHFSTKESDFQRKYRESIRACSPGPTRRLVNGQWQNLPLEGNDAIAHLIRQGVGPVPFDKNVKFFRGETWHKVFLDKQMKEELDRAIQIRLQPYSERLNDRLKVSPSSEDSRVVGMGGLVEAAMKFAAL